MEKIKRTFGFILNHPLSGKHVARSLWRFVIWQVQCSIRPDRLFVKQFVGPVKFYARRGLHGVTGNIYTSLHEFSEMAFLLHFLRSEDTFFDIGANVGAFSLLASGISHSRSFALEPVPSTFGILEQNVALNGLAEKLTAINAAAGSKQGTLAFTSDEDTTNHVIGKDDEGVNSISVPVVTVDSLLDESSPSLIKIDVEGFETEVLKGMNATLETSSLKAVIIELNGSGSRYGYDEARIHQLFLSKGFLPYDYEPFKRELKLRSGKGDFNTIYCRDLSFILGRLKLAAHIKVFGEKI